MKFPELLTILTCPREQSQPGACCIRFVYSFNPEAGIQIEDLEVNR